VAEEDSSQEKTEEATPRRLQKARDEGQVPRSKELTTSAVLLTGTVSLMVFGGFMANKMADILKYNFSLERATLFDNNLMFAHLGASFYEALLALIPFFIAVVIAAVAGPIALGGWLVSGKALAPKWDRINPLAGLKRMFSMKSLVELFKALGKVGVVLFAAYFMLQVMKSQLLGLSQESVEEGMVHSLFLSLTAAIVLSASTIFIVLIDVPFQVWDHSKKMRMSHQEIKDEMKETEGKPEVKSKIRQLQQEMAQRRMMETVPEADVVITNPTHFSVALKYNPETMETPLLLAKGVDHMALKIREIARAHDVEFVESPVLARAIYHTTDFEEEIPQGLYMAVAQVLAYVFQLREFRRGRGQRPVLPRKLDIPADMSGY